jgi:hypothetical protein
MGWVTDREEYGYNALADDAAGWIMPMGDVRRDERGSRDAGEVCGAS